MSSAQEAARAMREALEQAPKYEYVLGVYRCLWCKERKGRGHYAECRVAVMEQALAGALPLPAPEAGPHSQEDCGDGACEICWPKAGPVQATAGETAPCAYRKKPLVVEAIQWRGNNEQEVRDFLGAHTSGLIPGSQWRIHTAEGVMLASMSDWIIKGVKGEFYPCKPDIFAATYEPAALAAPAEGETWKERYETLWEIVQAFADEIATLRAQPAPEEPKA